MLLSRCPQRRGELERLYLLSPVLRNIAAALVLVNLAISFVMPRVPLRLLNAIDLSGERNAPALFSAGLLLIAALLLFAVARAHTLTRADSKWAFLAWLGLGFVFLFLAGCSGVPEMPNFSTESGRVCARSCQRTHAECMRGNMRASARRACNVVLGQCYQTCVDSK